MKKAADTERNETSCHGDRPMAAPRQYMILSLPNSGTDWLCPLLAKHAGLRYYEKEFFNPICNQQYGDVLEQAFGCELASCYRNIGVRAEDQADTLDRLYEETWARHDWHFDKENFAAFKVPFFARYFQLAFLYRAPESVFPPGRLRVWAWYDAIWNGLVENGHLERTSESLAERASLAHWVCWDEMRFWARTCNSPFLDYDLLCTADEAAVREHLSQGWVGELVDIGHMTQALLDTRRPHTKPRSPATTVRPGPGPG